MNGVGIGKSKILVADQVSKLVLIDVKLLDKILFPMTVFWRKGPTR